MFYFPFWIFMLYYINIYLCLGSRLTPDRSRYCIRQPIFLFSLFFTPFASALIISFSDPFYSKNLRTFSIYAFEVETHIMNKNTKVWVFCKNSFFSSYMGFHLKMHSVSLYEWWWATHAWWGLTQSDLPGTPSDNGWTYGIFNVPTHDSPERSDKKQKEYSLCRPNMKG